MNNMRKVNCLLQQLRCLMGQSLKERSLKLMALCVIKSPFKFQRDIVYHYKPISSPALDETLFREWYKEFRRRISLKLKGFALSVSILGAFDWNKERIEFDTVKDELKEFDFVERLKMKIICRVCSKRILIGNVKVEGIEYCSCDREQQEVLRLAEKRNGHADATLDDEENWEPYIERHKMITWRREIRPGLYAYKVYVEYSDVSAEDFLFVQTDNDYRKQWDETAIKLDIIDAEEKTNSQVIYWEMLWPKFFSNRDYVYKRRYFIDDKTNQIIIVNKSTKHPKCPPNPYKQRVDEYWSFMIIRPKTTLSKPGLEFVLTYFDNPGLSIPKRITTWVAQRQMPDFLDKLHIATLNYAKVKKTQMKRNKSVLEKDPGYEYPNLDNRDDVTDDDSEDETDNLSNNSEQGPNSPLEDAQSTRHWWNLKNLFLF
ncbi:stAR-related lipid transfer protein 7, mitochondrial [Culicoides brevitarsis]|uniref:stAR-related lipid transfer protein 7, mitochondrial n=1 Tax=Culicoides brevitarsis TaxID=469753 RepID=UPI00307BDC8D